MKPSSGVVNIKEAALRNPVVYPLYKVTQSVRLDELYGIVSPNIQPM